MTFTLYKASDDDFEQTITVNNIAELKEIYPSLIINFEDMIITIYDYWVE